MAQALPGRKICEIEVLQPKCPNVPAGKFTQALTGASLRGVAHRGKWLVVDTTGGFLLVNLGMGGEILLVPSDALPRKWRVRFAFEDGETLTVNFWWFGYVHYVPLGKLDLHPMVAALGPDALDLTLSQFCELLKGRRGGIKAVLLDQSRVAGIGNAYIHDILFRARLHPLRGIATLSDEDVKRLHRAIHTELVRSIEKGGAFYEVGLDGKPGGFSGSDLLVGYREGRPCPECGTSVEKIKTGSTASFVCPRCQPLKTR